MIALFPPGSDKPSQF